ARYRVYVLPLSSSVERSIGHLRTKRYVPPQMLHSMSGPFKRAQTIRSVEQIGIKHYLAGFNLTSKRERRGRERASPMNSPACTSLVFTRHPGRRGEG